MGNIESVNNTSKHKKSKSHKINKYQLGGISGPQQIEFNKLIKINNDLYTKSKNLKNSNKNEEIQNNIIKEFEKSNEQIVENFEKMVNLTIQVFEKINSKTEHALHVLKLCYAGTSTGKSSFTLNMENREIQQKMKLVMN